MLAAGRESDRFLLRLTQLVEAPRRAHANLDGIGLEVVVFGLASVGSHGDCHVPDLLGLVD
jgi:hypothetical protein